MSYQAYQRVGHGYGCFTKLTKGSGMERLLVPVFVPDPGYFNKVVPGTRVFYRRRTELTKVSVRVWKSYQAYQSVGYG